MPGRKSDYQLVGCNYLYFAPGDWRALSAALKQEFAGIRFYVHPTLESVGKTEIDELLRDLKRRGLVPDDRLADIFWNDVVPLDRAVDWHIPFIDSFVDEVEGFPRTGYEPQPSAAIFPSGWKPVWGIAAKRPFPRILNLPRTHFSVRRSTFDTGKNRSMESWTRVALRAEGPGDCVFLRSGTWIGEYKPHEPEVRDFLMQVRRIFGKNSTIRHCEFEFKTGAVRWRRKTGRSHRFGYHALDWANEQVGHIILPDQNFGLGIKPIDWNPPANWDESLMQSELKAYGPR